MKIIVGHNLVKSFGEADEKRIVLEDVSVEIGEGEFVSVMGPSGSGKSTLLGNLNLLDNIMLPSVRGNAKNSAKIAEKARSLMERMGIAGLEKRGMAQVSGGQLQRAGICRAMMSDPKIIFGDEPTGALNSKAAQEVMDIFSAINGDGTAIMLVTHDAGVAARTECILFMLDGKIVSELRLSKFEGGRLEERIEAVTAQMREIGI